MNNNHHVVDDRSQKGKSGKIMPAYLHQMIQHIIPGQLGQRRIMEAKDRDDQLTSSQQAIHLPITRKVCTPCMKWLRANDYISVRPFVQVFFMRGMGAALWSKESNGTIPTTKSHGSVKESS